VRRHSRDELAALNVRITELSRAGKYSEAIPLAHRLLANPEKAFGGPFALIGEGLQIVHCSKVQREFSDPRPIVTQLDRRKKSRAAASI
jgi:hypothetical protein